MGKQVRPNRQRISELVRGHSGTANQIAKQAVSLAKKQGVMSSDGTTPITISGQTIKNWTNTELNTLADEDKLKALALVFKVPLEALLLNAENDAPRSLPLDYEVATANRVLAASRYFANNLEVFCLLRDHPVLLPKGNFTADDETTIVAAAETEKLEANQKPNMPHAYLELDSIIELDCGRPKVQYSVIDFATVQALRKRGQVPLLSVCTILFSRELNSVFLHRRTAENDTYGGYLHTIGGAFLPRHFQQTQLDQDLTGTAVRKIREKTNVLISVEKSFPIAMTQETQTGFVQVVVPVEVNQSQAKQLRDSECVETIEFSALGDALVSDKVKDLPWNPTGRAQILCWLLLNTPPAISRLQFGTATPHQLFDHVVASLPQ